MAAGEREREGLDDKRGSAVGWMVGLALSLNYAAVAAAAAADATAAADPDAM